MVMASECREKQTEKKRGGYCSLRRRFLPSIPFLICKHPYEHTQLIQVAISPTAPKIKTSQVLAHCRKRLTGGCSLEAIKAAVRAGFSTRATLSPPGRPFGANGCVVQDKMWPSCVCLLRNTLVPGSQAHRMSLTLAADMIVVGVGLRKSLCRLLWHNGVRSGVPQKQARKQGRHVVGPL